MSTVEPKRHRAAPATSDQNRDEPPVLSHLLAAAVDQATSVHLRNPTEAQALLALRAALRFAISGEFDATVRDAIGRMTGVAAAHDVRRSAGSGFGIDHLVMAPGGVYVVDSVVSAAKVTYDSDGVLLDKGRHRGRDSMVDDLAQEVAEVIELAQPIPVHGLIVFPDLLSLPAEIRTGGVTIKGVHLLTLPLLEGVLTRPGPVDNVRSMLSRLRESFQASIPDPGIELHIDQLRALAAGR